MTLKIYRRIGSGKAAVYGSLLLAVFASRPGAAQTPRNCPYCDLRGKSFAGQDLRNANFTGAKLDGADFTGANLSGAVFNRASLVSATFRNARMESTPTGPTVFSQANLTGASFSGASMPGAVLQYARLDRANFERANLSNVRFGAKLYINPSDAAAQPQFDKSTMSCDAKEFGRQLDFSSVVFPLCDEPVQKRPPVPEVPLQRMILPREPGQALEIISTTEAGSATASAADTVWVALTGTDAATCGQPASPCRSIGHAAAKAPAGGVVAVEFGEYELTSTVLLTRSLKVIGGFLDRQPTGDQSAVAAPPDGAPAFRASGQGVEVQFVNFLLNGSAAVSKNKASTVLQGSSSATITLRYTTITANQGGPGDAGAAGAAGHDGGAGGAGNARGDGKGGIPGESWTRDSWGGNGAERSWAEVSCRGFCTNRTTFHDYDGLQGHRGTTGYEARGGTHGSGVSYSCPKSQRPTSASAAEDGRSAGCGAGGVAATNEAGSFASGAWQPVPGGTGGSGGTGGGGGGGGSGGPCGYCNCFCSGSSQRGTAGGGGGAGGSGGGGGAGGLMGGASFGVVLDDAGCLVDGTVTITSGAGGDGGAGGRGNTGGKGGAGGAAEPAGSVCSSTGASGSAGGRGGVGGASGGGAGGNGGPAIGIALSNSSRVSGTATFYQGLGGRGGAGGDGGTAAERSPCIGGKGNAGAAGAAKDMHQY